MVRTRDPDRQVAAASRPAVLRPKQKAVLKALCAEWTRLIDACLAASGVLCRRDGRPDVSGAAEVIADLVSAGFVEGRPSPTIAGATEIRPTARAMEIRDEMLCQ